MVGEPFVEPAQQGHIDSRWNAVLPLSVQYEYEQLAMERVHRCVVLAYLGGSVRVSALNHFASAVRQFSCKTAHFGKIAVRLLRQGSSWVTASGDLGDVQRQAAHPFGVGDVLQ